MPATTSSTVSLAMKSIRHRSEHYNTYQSPMIPSGLGDLATILALLRNVQSVMQSRLLLALCVRAQRLVAVLALWLSHLALSANDRTSVVCRHRVQSRWFCPAPAAWSRAGAVAPSSHVAIAAVVVSVTSAVCSASVACVGCRAFSRSFCWPRGIFDCDKSSLSSSSTASIELKPSLTSRSTVFAVILCAVAHSRVSLCPSSLASLTGLGERTTPSSCPSERSQHRLPRPHKDSKAERIWPCSRT